MCKKITEIKVQQGPCGFITIDAGVCRFHLPKAMAESLVQSLVHTLSNYDDVYNLPIAATKESDTKEAA